MLNDAFGESSLPEFAWQIERPDLPARAKVLIVDDSPRNLFTLEKVLRDLDIEIIQATSGNEALLATLAHSFALAILDVQMPGMDGYELAAILRGDENTRRIPIIFLTAAYADERHLFQGYESGGVDYIVKPYDRRVLLGKVRVFLELARYRMDLENMVEMRTRALQESQERLSLAVKGAGVGLWDWRVQTGETIFTEMWAQIVGYTLKALAPISIDTWRRLVHPDDLATSEHALQRHFAGETDFYECEARMKHKSGHWVWILDRGKVLAWDHAGKPDRMAGTHVDITERKQAERERVKLLQAKAESQAKSAVLARMSHEIRTPMNAILGYAQLLGLEAGLTSQQREYLSTIDRSAEHLLALIDDVLDMAKIEADRMALTPAAVDLHDLMVDMERMFRLRAADKGLALHLQYGRELPRMVRMDAGKVRQVMINLIGNALKFTETGGIEIQVGLKTGVKRPCRMTVTVTDSGIGIPEDQQSLIFEAFQQTDAGARQAGTGLGLAVSRQLARLMGGDITVSSRPTHGSSFHFEFAVEPLAASEAGPPQPSETAKVVGLSSQGPPPKVLVAAAQRHDRALWVRMLSSVGFAVRIAGSWQDTFNACDTESPDLLLIDERMNAMAALQQMQARPGKAHPPVLIVSANGLETAGAAGVHTGVNGFLRKPVREDQLFREIGRLLNVTYIYAGDSPKPASSADDKTLDAADLAQLPHHLIDELNQAVEGGFIQRIDQCIARLEASAPVVGRQLRELAEGFRYDAILNFLAKA